MNKCKCGAILQPEWQYCPYCGNKLRSGREELKVPAPKKVGQQWSAMVCCNGVNKRISAPTEKGYYTAARAFKAGLIELKNNPASITARDAVNSYCDSKSNILSPSTIANYKALIAAHFKQYRDKPLSAVNWQLACNRELSTATAYTTARAYKIIRIAAAAAGVELPKVQLPKTAHKEKPFLDAEQIPIFLQAIRGNRSEAAFLLGLHSLRMSEALDITADDIHDNSITVCGAAVRDESGKLVHKASNKNLTSRRVIPVLIPRLLELVPASGYLITVDGQTVNNDLRRVLSAAGLPEMTFHSLRHSFASLCYIIDGVDAKTAQRLGGWANSAVIDRVYTHLSEAQQAASVQLLRDYFKQLTPTAGNSGGADLDGNQ